MDDFQEDKKYFQSNINVYFAWVLLTAFPEATYMYVPPILCLYDFTINRCVALIGSKDSLNPVVTKLLTYFYMMIDQDRYGQTRIQPVRLDTKGFFD